MTLLLSRSSSAHAQSFDVSYAFDVSIEGLRPGDIACIGEPVHFMVRLSETVQERETFAEYMLYVDASNMQGRGQFIADRLLLGFDILKPDAVIFTYEPQSEGEEQVFFETLVPTVFSLANEPIYVSSPSIRFDVDDCAPKVEGVWNWRYPVPGLTTIGTGELAKVTLEPQDDTGTEFAGTGPFTFSYIQIWGVPSCWTSFSDTTSDASFTAHRSGDTLDISLTFGEAVVNATGGCLDVASSASEPADFNRLGVSGFSVPASGGIASVPTIAGGNMTFIVTREPEAGG